MGDKARSRVEDKPDLVAAVSERLQPAFAIFGSAAAVSAFLLFAGFLSDFAAYRIAGLPRLSFSLTAAAESGAEVLIDSFALLSTGIRLPILALMIAGVVIVWSRHESALLRRLARSAELYRAVRLLLLIWALLMFGGLVDRAQRSFSGDLYSQVTVEKALVKAYAEGFADPVTRRRELEKPGYELNFYAVPNWLADLEPRWRRMLDWGGQRLGFNVAMQRSQHEQGIYLRVLPESRLAAQDVFGWISLSLLVLMALAVLCQWWAAWLKKADVATIPGQETSSAGYRRRAWNRLRIAVMRIFDSDLQAPVERFVVPLTFLLISLSISLLPLAHGLLARGTLGGEAVMVYLNKAEEAKTGNAGDSVARTRHAAHTCDPKALKKIDNLRGDLDKAARDVTRFREEQQGAVPAVERYALAVNAVADAVVAANCSEAVRNFWFGRPSAGLANGSVAVAEAFRRALLKVTRSYNVRVGNILSYPRDGQALVLVEQTVQRQMTQGALSSVIGIEARDIDETVVLGSSVRRLDEIAVKISRDPDNTAALEQLLVYPNALALEEIIRLVEEKRLHASAKGVAVTSIGGMAWVSLSDRPHATRRAIDLLFTMLADLDGANIEHKRAALTSLHLTRNVYAGYLLARALQRESTAPCRSSPDESRIRCTGEVLTAAGYLAADLAEEENLFNKAHVPAELKRAKEVLLAFLAESVAAPGGLDSFRGAACTALGRLGYTALPQNAELQFWRSLQEGMLTRTFSTPSCVSRMPLLGMNSPEHRKFLRGLVLQPVPHGGDTGYIDRLRRAAILALSEMGLQDEAEFIVAAFLSDNSTIHKHGRLMLDEVRPEMAAPLLLHCAKDAGGEPQRRVRCMSGLALLDKNFDGDDGTAEAVYSFLGSSLLRDSACTVLRSYHERNSAWTARRVDSDSILAQCLADQPAAPPSQQGASVPTRLPASST